MQVVRQNNVMRDRKSLSAPSQLMWIRPFDELRLTRMETFKKAKPKSFEVSTVASAHGNLLKASCELKQVEQLLCVSCMKAQTGYHSHFLVSMQVEQMLTKTFRVARQVHTHCKTPLES